MELKRITADCVGNRSIDIGDDDKEDDVRTGDGKYRVTSSDLVVLHNRCPCLILTRDNVVN